MLVIQHNKIILANVSNMTQLSQGRRTLPPRTPVDPEVIKREQEVQKALRERCRPIFERLRPSLRETYPNWFIAIHPDTEEYILDPTLRGLCEKISGHVPKDNTIRMIFCLNDSGTCGRI